MNVLFYALAALCEKELILCDFLLKVNRFFFTRFVFNPSLQSPEDAQAFRFLGILLGVAIRTKKPLDLHLAPIVWKLLAGKICLRSVSPRSERIAKFRDNFG